MSTLTANAEIFASIGVLGLSLILAVVSAVSYARLKHTRIMFIGWSFVVFAVKGAYLVQKSVELRGSEAWVLATALMDFVVLVLLYMALRIR